jgi:hypothetical protein
MDEKAVREAIVRQFRDDRDLDSTHEIYHEDAILEFPQSGERFIGKRSFLTWRKQFPADVKYRIRRITGGADLRVVELLVSYNGSPWMFGISLMWFRGDRIAREAIYVMDGFAPSDTRSQWATMFDGLASVPPEEWEADAPFGIE